jgi:hypothetical protein
MKMESWMKMRLQKSTKSFWSCTQDLEEIDYISMVSLYNMYSWFGRNIIYFWGRRSRDRGSWIYNYLCNQCLSPLTLRVRIPLRRGVLYTSLCDLVCPWLTVGRWFSPGTRIWFGPVNCSFQFLPNLGYNSKMTLLTSVISSSSKTPFSSLSTLANNSFVSYNKIYTLH